MANATPKLGDTFQNAWKSKYGLEFNPDYYYREFGPAVVKALEEQVQAMNDEEIIQFVNDIDSTKLYALPYTSKTPNMTKKIQENISNNPEAISPPKPGAINPNQTIYANPNPKPQDTTPPDAPAPAQDTNEKPNFFERIFSPAGEAAVANARAVQDLPQIAGETLVDNYQKAGGVIKDTVQDIGQGISDQFNFNQSQRNKETGAIPAPKESDYRPKITEEDGEKKITFSEGLFTRFMRDYSTMMITEYEKQPKTGQDPGPDPLYDMIRGKQGG